MYEPKDKSSEKNNWNTKFNTAPAPVGAPKTANVWNTRFDWMPTRNGATTYLGKSMPSSLNASNAKKPC